MSKSVKVVTCRFEPVVRSWAQMLYRWAGPRSERKYSVSPCHIGWASLAGLSLTFSASSVSRIEEPDLRRGSAPVALPRAEPAGLRGVGDAPPVGRQRAELAVGHGEPLRLTALDRDAVDLPEGGQAALPVGSQEDAPAVWRPVEDPVAARMVCDSRWCAAQGRDDVDVVVAVVVAAEGDVRAVGREPREGLFPGRRAQLAGRAALLGHHPDVAGVDEGDLRLGDVGIAQHPGVDLGPGRRRAQRNEQRQRSGEMAHLLPRGVRNPELLVTCFRSVPA